MGRRGFVVICVLYAVGMTLLILAMASFMHFPPPPVRSAGAVAAIVLFVMAARRAPVHIIGADASGSRCVRPVLFGVVGWLGLFGFFVLTFGSRAFGLPPVVGFVAVPAYVALVGGLVWLMAGRGAGMGERQMLALATGALLFLGFFDVLREANKATQPDDPTGLSLVAVSALAFLTWLNLRTRRRVLRQLREQAGP